ncbi:hypothetical protein FSP39_017148 [Pinctada imbricata]|uniref:RING-CH-type domain-containing protein n=1 Tax=Pinctada imbricata TaxID=66713 RepID=A0AA89C250_PINIB|nr:hypothetical protein FSP39_017148 [Pinctada imbricata]
MSVSTEKLFSRSGENKSEDGGRSDEDMELRQVKSDPIPSGNDDATPTSTTTATDIDLVLPTSSTSTTSSSETVCRICQSGSRDTSEELQTTACDCKGNMSRVHETCLRQWVRYKGSNKCEICNVRFGNILAPPNPGILQLEALQQLQWHLDRIKAVQSS